MKSKISFVHNFQAQARNNWNDGLAAAMRILAQDYEVIYDTTETFEEADVILVWGGSYSPEAEWLRNLDHPRKVLLYAGGPLDVGYFERIHHVVLETPTDSIQDTSTSYAFGTNTTLFKPQNAPKLFNGILPAGYAAWKRQHIFADALGSRGLLCGPKQDIETECYVYPESRGVLTLPEVSPAVLPYFYSASYALVNTASYWGGCQRTILEAMACGIPVIVMADSSRNKWFIDDSGNGYIVEPHPQAIKEAIQKIKERTWDTRRYVMEKWPETKYARDLESAFLPLLTGQGEST